VAAIMDGHPRSACAHVASSSSRIEIDGRTGVRWRRIGTHDIFSDA
jgi:hypothetical protein